MTSANICCYAHRVWCSTCRKLVALFGLAQQLLSRQQHYDWGLRALKTCLAISGRLLREHRAAGQQVNQVSETQVVIRGVQLATMPKLTFEDTNRCTLQKPVTAEHHQHLGICCLGPDMQACVHTVLQPVLSNTSDFMGCQLLSVDTGGGVHTTAVC